MPSRALSRLVRIPLRPPMPVPSSRPTTAQSRLPSRLPAPGTAVMFEVAPGRGGRRGPAGRGPAARAPGRGPRRRSTDRRLGAGGGRLGRRVLAVWVAARFIGIRTPRSVDGLGASPFFLVSVPVSVPTALTLSLPATKRLTLYWPAKVAPFLRLAGDLGGLHGAELVGDRLDCRRGGRVGATHEGDDGQADRYGQRPGGTTEHLVLLRRGAGAPPRGRASYGRRCVLRCRGETPTCQT